MVERRSAARSRPGCTRTVEPARLLEDDDLHGLAQRRPVRPRRRGLGAALDAARHEQPARACSRASSSPAPPTYDGYMLRTNQLAGTDQVCLERSTTAPSSTCLTINQELAAGDVLLLRVKGSTPRGLAPRRLGLVAPRRRSGRDLRRRRLRRRRPARDDRAARRLRGADVRRAAARHRAAERSGNPERDRRRARPRSTSPGGRRPTTSASPSTASSAARAPAARTSPRSRRRTSTSYLEHRPHRLDLLLLPRARRRTPPSTSGPYSNTATATTPAPPDTEPPSAPGTLSATAVEPDPDRPHLGGGHRQRRRHPLPHRALPGRRLLGLRRDRRRATSTSFSNTRPHRLDLLLLPRARRGRRPQPRCLLEHGERDDAGAARHRAAERAGHAERDRRRARPRSTSPGGRRPTTSASTLYRIERCQGAGCSNFAEIAHDAPRRATRTPASPPRPRTPTACAPRTPRSTSVPTRTRRAASTPAPPDTEPPGAPGTLEPDRR